MRIVLKKTFKFKDSPDIIDYEFIDDMFKEKSLQFLINFYKSVNEFQGVKKIGHYIIIKICF